MSISDHKTGKSGSVTRRSTLSRSQRKVLDQVPFRIAIWLPQSATTQLYDAQFRPTKTFLSSGNASGWLWARRHFYDEDDRRYVIFNAFGSVQSWLNIAGATVLITAFIEASDTKDFFAITLAPKAVWIIALRVAIVVLFCHILRLINQNVQLSHSSFDFR